MAVAVNAGLGAALGAFIDHDRVGRSTVFKRSPSVQFSPALTSQRGGLAVSLSF